MRLVYFSRQRLLTYSLLAHRLPVSYKLLMYAFMCVTTCDIHVSRNGFCNKHDFDLLVKPMSGLKWQLNGSICNFLICFFVESERSKTDLGPKLIFQIPLTV